MKQTPLQKAIEQCNTINDEHPYKERGNRDSYSQYNEGWCDAIDRVQQYLHSLLPYERECIEEAYKNGGNNEYWYTASAHDYFTNTFKTNPQGGGGL